MTELNIISEPGEWACLKNRKKIHIIADSVDKTFITITCPFCRSKYNKDGKPHKLVKKVFHYHGSGNNFSNRMESRVPHCGEKSLELQSACFKNISWEIHITDKTKRIF
jgi:hypothetical protein